MFRQNKTKNTVATVLGAVSSFFFSFVFVHAQTPGPIGGPNPGPKPAGIINPLEFNCVSELIFAVVDAVAQIGFYIVILFIIYSGFLFVKARGNPEELKKAKQTFLWTVIGAAILLGASLLANVIDGTLDQLKSGEGPQGSVEKCN